jgi:hypothetical protein
LFFKQQKNLTTKLLFHFQKTIHNNIKFGNRKKKNAAAAQQPFFFFFFFPPILSFFLSGGEISPKREF